MATETHGWLAAANCLQWLLWLMSLTANGGGLGNLVFCDEIGFCKTSIVAVSSIVSLNAVIHAVNITY